MATPNIVPQEDQEGGLGTASKAWGKLFIENATDGGTAAATINNLDIDKTALSITATNTTANVIDIASTALTTGAIFQARADALTTGSCISMDVNDALTASATKSLIKIDYDKAGVTGASATSATTGLDINMADGATNHASGAVNMIGAQVDVDAASDQGDITQKGLVLNVGADGTGDASTTSGIEMEVMDGGTDIKMMSHADTADYCTIGVTTNGATTITTVDGGAAAANFEVVADGNITLTAAGHTSIPTRKMTVTSTSTHGDHNGDVVYFGTGTVAAGKIYHYKNDGSWELADANTVANCDGLLGVALSAGTASTVGMLLRGMVTLIDIQGSEAVGDVLYLSEAATGEADCVAPDGSGDVIRVIGYCLNTDDCIWFNPDSTFVELA